MSPALEIARVSKSFGDVRAADDVQLSVPAGSFLGLVGPNGAGKTTLLSIAVGLLRPDRGRVRVCGYDVWQEPDAGRAKALLGVMPDGLALPDRLTGPELLSYLGLLRGLPKAVVASRTHELLAVLDLTGSDHQLIGDYSTGMRKKISLAAALLHGPSVLILDEPFEAIDPVSAVTIRSVLAGVQAHGGTIVLSSHSMLLVEQTCDRVAVMATGRLVRDGSLASVRGAGSLQDAFLELVGQTPGQQELSWYAG